jgi:hypothetical protein
MIVARFIRAGDLCSKRKHRYAALLLLNHTLNTSATADMHNRADLSWGVVFPVVAGDQCQIRTVVRSPVSC